MRGISKDEAPPKTGGITNRANPIAASRLKPGISKSAFRIYAICPKTRNEPNSRIPSAPPPPITRNEPNLPAPPPPLFSRAVLPAVFPHDPNKRNEPNFTPAHDQNVRNEPNSSTPTRIARFPTTQKRETNPISVEAPNLRTTNNQLRTIFTKRTQLPPRSILPRWPKVSPELSRNPIPVPHISCPPNHPQICETNPIHHPTPSFPPSPLYFLLSPLSRVTARATQSQHGPRPKQTKRTQFPTINIQSTIYNIQSPGPILTNQNSLSPCCIGTWINSGEVCYAGDFVAFWICHFLEPP